MKISSLRITLLIARSAVVIAFFVGHIAFAQICKPVSQRTGEVGCWIMANTTLGLLPKEPIFWHLYTYPTRKDADAAKGPRGTVVESLGKVWLFTIDVEGWHSPSGERVAAIGPLPVVADVKYSSQYMEAIFTPGMTAPPHRHAGPEAWYTLTGQTCLETSEGYMIGQSGGPAVIVRGGLPMHLTATGKETRRALVLILHDSTQPPTTPASDWVPVGLCVKQWACHITVIGCIYSIVGAILWGIQIEFIQMEIGKMKIYQARLNNLTEYLTTVNSYKYKNETNELTILATENFYFRNNSTQLNMVVIKQHGEDMIIDVIGAAGGTGLFNITWGSQRGFIKETQKIIEEFCSKNELKSERIT